ncbi:nuclear GTPase SLIP-GC-like isoform X2 [Chanodichthys erythropterus]
MEAFHGMKRNTPPLLPVPSQSSSSAYGTKRKRESPDWTMNSSLTMDEIMEGVRQIMKRFPKNSDKIDKSNRKKATIGIFGTSGEGKSSLLSAILGKKNLLPSGCFGACTAVVTQVEANLTDSNYIAELELFSKEEWEKELIDLFSVLSDKSEDRDDELYEIAVEKINAVYGNDADEKTLEELKNDAKFAEIEYFLSTNKDNFSKSDINEFIDEVASYIQHSQSSSGNWYWPLVKSVKIKIPNCRELLEHIVLVDIPGSGDCNKIRHDLWKSKLRDCSSVWIISSINRASTDSGPWGILKHCTEELGPGGECKHINFICTKTDDIDPENYVRGAQLSRDQIPEDKDQKKVCILHRNKNAKMKVKKKFEKSKLKKIFSTDDQFQVFTVSSKAFFDQDLNLESSETEIPKLQDELRTLNKSMNRELVRDYVNEAKGTLLLIQSVQRDTDRKMMKMKVMELEKNLMKALNELDKYFDSIYSDLEQCLSKGVEESVKSCVDSTKKLITKKDGRGFHKILGALCKNYGCYWSKNWDEVLDLNKTLAKHLHTCIDEDFIKIFPVTETTGKSVQEQIDKFSIIQSDSANPSSPMHHIENFIKNEKETQLTPLLNRKIVDMKKLIYSSIQTTIQNEMISCYKEAAAVTGTGSMKKRQELLITTVDEIKHDMFNKAKMEVLKTLNTLKLLIMDALEKELKKAIERLQSQTSKIREDVSEYIEQLERLSDQLSD